MFISIIFYLVFLLLIHIYTKCVCRSCCVVCLNFIQFSGLTSHNYFIVFGYTITDMYNKNKNKIEQKILKSSFHVFTDELEAISTPENKILVESLHII